MKDETLLLVVGGVAILGAGALLLTSKTPATAAPPSSGTKSTLPPIAVPALIVNPKAPPLKVIQIGHPVWVVGETNKQYPAGTHVRFSFPAAGLPATFGATLKAAIQAGSIGMTNASILAPYTATPADWPAGDPNGANAWHVDAFLTAPSTVMAKDAQTFNPPTGQWGSTAWVA